MKKTDTTNRTQEKRKGFIKKIGNTTYDVSFHYSRQNRESMNDKIIRLIEKRYAGQEKQQQSVYMRSMLLISAGLSVILRL